MAGWVDEQVDKWIDHHVDRRLDSSLVDEMGEDDFRQLKVMAKKGNRLMAGPSPGRTSRSMTSSSQ